MRKVVMVLLDGCRFDYGIENMGYLMHLVEKKKAALYKVIAELPSLSRPCYEVLCTGTPALVNGITDNSIVRCSNQVSLFDLVKGQGGVSAAASYHWISQLYNKADFDLANDRFQDSDDLAIQHGIFYDDVYPDKCLFADAWSLISRYDPNFMFMLPMSVDEYGHIYGADTEKYRLRIAQADTVFGQFIPKFIEAGYDVVVTSDHGMDPFGHHGGTTADVRETPFFVISDKVTPGDFSDEPLPQLAVAPIICDLLGIKPSDAMVNKVLD